jgi:hypothetical protein
MAIERALLDGVADEEIRKALRRLDTQLQGDPDDVAGRDLERLARRTLKSSGGLHAQFVDLLPGRHVPVVAARILDQTTRCVVERDTGLHQL